MRYKFATNETTAGRLEAISRIFNPHSQRFIKGQAKNPVISAVDLGCGPGFTTHMLFMALQAGEIYGIDNSEEYLMHAMNRVGHCVFLKHDLTKTPFPVSSDIMYARFVLSHLKDPIAMINRWSNELNLGGTLFIEELEGISTDVEVFERYLDINKMLVESQGAELYVGKAISGGSYYGEVIVNETFEFEVSNRDAASMFYPNTVSIWENEEYILNNICKDERNEISGRIKGIIDSGDKTKGITWKMRRIAIRKAESYEYQEMFI